MVLTNKRPNLTGNKPHRTRNKPNRIKPNRNVVFTVHQSEFIDAQKDEFGLSASDIVRRAMDFYITYGVRPEIMTRVIAEIKKNGEEAAQDLAKHPDKVAA